MTTQQIKNLIKDIDNFESAARDRANKLLKLDDAQGWFDKVLWSECDKNFICIRVSDKWDAWSQYFPVECFADDFNIENYRKERETSTEENLISKDDESVESGKKTDYETYPFSMDSCYDNPADSKIKAFSSTEAQIQNLTQNVNYLYTEVQKIKKQLAAVNCHIVKNLNQNEHENNYF